MESSDYANTPGDVKAQPTVFKLGYEPALDGLRGLAILSVMAFNAHFLLMKGGFIGVDIFFVLSGFLITALLVQGYHRTSTIGFRNFYLRRALRLLPALFLLMLFCVGYALLLQPYDKAINTLKGVLYTLFYVANWAQVPPYEPGIGALSHAWSLSVEEQFYIVWPLLLFILLKVKNKVVVLATLVGLIAISILLNIWFWQAGVPHLRMYFGSDTRAHELLIGCVAALLLSWGIVRRGRGPKWVFHAASVVSLAGILASFVLVQHNTAFVYNGGFALISIGTAILIVDFLLFPSALSRVFEFAPLVWIGKISYGLYLWHFPIFEASRKLLEDWVSPIVYQLIGLALTVVVATASYYLLELPFLRLRHRFNTADPGTVFLPAPARSA